MIEARTPADLVLCPACAEQGRRTILAERIGDCYVIRHAGRRWIVRELIAVTCTTCGAPWRTKAGDG